jgi:hypothetical protein
VRLSVPDGSDGLARLAIGTGTDPGRYLHHDRTETLDKAAYYAFRSVDTSSVDLQVVCGPSAVAVVFG